MAKAYPQPGDRIQTVCELSYAGKGNWVYVQILDDPVRFWREDEAQEEDGEWFHMKHGFIGTRSTNPNYAQPYYEDDDPGY